MKKGLVYFFFIYLSLFFLYSCKKDKEIPQLLSFNYFPTEQGSYVIYNVDSIVHGDNDNNTDDSVTIFTFS